MSLPALLHIYMNWQDRFIPPRPREVGFWNGFWRHGLGNDLIPAALRLQRRIAAGEDLTPFLSRDIKRYGYVRPRTDNNGKRRGIDWGDKDYALNAYDVHHLHLGEPRKAGGQVKRTDELMYALFSRHHAMILMVGDHRSFDDGTLAQAIAEARAEAGEELKGILPGNPAFTHDERNRLQRNGISTHVSVGNKVVIGAFLTSAGGSLYHTRHADEMILTIEHIEPLLDDDSTARKWFNDANIPYPNEPKFSWMLQYCDLGVYEHTSPAFFSLLRWRR